MPQIGKIALWGLVLSAAVLLFWVVNQVNLLLNRRDEASRLLEESQQEIQKAYQRLEAMIQVSQQLTQAGEEKEVIDSALRLSIELVGAEGAVFVPLDDHGQPQAAVSIGVPLDLETNEWLEYVASPAVRESCRVCKNRALKIARRVCPLGKNPFAGSREVFCLSLANGEKEMGVLTLFLGEKVQIDPRSQTFLIAFMDETALALEGVRLRRRELETLKQIQSLRKKTDLTSSLEALLENAHNSLEADFSLISVTGCTRFLADIELEKGDLAANVRPLIMGVLQGVMDTGEPVSLGEVTVEKNSNGGVGSIIAAPLYSDELSTLGGFVVGYQHAKMFSQRQVALLQTVAGQAALIIQNANLLAELEYKTMIEERTRLAREIHDGLAQTLGFLKLQLAQMKNYLVKQEYDRLHQSLQYCYTSLGEAYTDARQAIDGLRVGMGEEGMVGWLEQVRLEFMETSNIEVDLEPVEIQSTLPPEVHAQFIRIVQEALSNVRKHAQANQVRIACREINGVLWLEIRDNGRGFSPEDVPAPSRHGLRGMRERADLIGADFQVISQYNEGTIISIALPTDEFKFGEVTL
jgi:two-component system nitrate/nitrite sensor histidine kinase NarX